MFVLKIELLVHKEYKREKWTEKIWTGIVCI